MDTRRIEEVFDTVRRLPTAERPAALDEACGADDALRTEVESLLRADEAASGWRPPTGRHFASWTDGKDPWIGTTVGGCVVRRKIAHGGMGVVYEAEQESPRRTVALKFMRSPISTEQERIRFEQEASVLGRLRHEGVAAVHRAGTHREGSNLAMPYIVMEFVADAEPITEFVAREGRETASVLELFLGVCDAMHHAHERGVIHRDLKPSNIIVGAEGGAKVIDFGIAKSDVVEDGTPALTRTGQMLGTIAYASPEQMRGRHEQIGTRSDIYALGLVLYELLTGKRPYELDENDLLAAARQIDGAPVPAHEAVASDVLRILRRALAKEPAERYDSVAAFAEDLRRFQRGEPVAARPPSVTYQIRLFARRHRALVAVAGASLIALIALTIVSVRSAAEARIQAAAAKRESKRSGQMLEASQRALGRVASDFFDEVEPLPGSLRARQVIADALERGLQELKLEAGDKPELRRLAALTATHLARVYGAPHSNNTGDVERALEMQRDALHRLQELEKEAPSTNLTRDLFLAHMQMSDFLFGKGEIDAATRHGDDAAARYAQLRRDGVELDNETQARWVAFQLGRSWQLPSRDDARVDLLKSALRTAESMADDTTPGRPMALAEVHGNLGQVYITRREFKESKTHLDASRDAFAEAKRRFGSELPLLSHLGLLHMRYGDLANSRRDLPQAVEHYTECAKLLRTRLTFEPDNAKNRMLVTLAVSRLARAHRLLADRYWKLPLPKEWTDQAPDVDKKKRAWMHLTSARSFAKEAIDSADRLVARNPSGAKPQHARTEARFELCDILARIAAFEERDRQHATADEEVAAMQKSFPRDEEVTRLAAKAKRVRGTGFAMRAFYHGIRTEQELAVASLEKAIAWLEQAQTAYESADPSVAKSLGRTIDHYRGMLKRAR